MIELQELSNTVLDEFLEDPMARSVHIVVVLQSTVPPPGQCE